MPSRRCFLQTASAVSIASTAPRWLTSLAAATPAERDQRVLVVVQLSGGNDGLNTVVPYGDDGYGRARKTLRLKESDLLKIDDRLALHPRMGAAKSLLDDGRLAIVQGVGYPKPDRSHFRSMRIWHTANATDPESAAYGWLGRTLDRDGPSVAESDAVCVGAEQPPSTSAASPASLWASGLR